MKSQEFSVQENALKKFDSLVLMGMHFDEALNAAMIEIESEDFIVYETALDLLSSLVLKDPDFVKKANIETIFTGIREEGIDRSTLNLLHSLIKIFSQKENKELIPSDFIEKTIKIITQGMNHKSKVIRELSIEISETLSLDMENYQLLTEIAKKAVKSRHLGT